MRRLIKKIYSAFSNTDGFTLLEMVIATAASSLIMLLVYAGHKSIMSAVQELTGVADFYENLNMAIRRIDKDFSYMFINKTNKDICVVGENDSGAVSNGKIFFITTDYTDFAIGISPKKQYPHTDIKEVGYSLAPDKKIPGLFYLMRREKQNYDDSPGKGGDESLMLENVLDIKFEFWVGNNWTGKWDSRVDKRFPTGIKTTMKIKNYRGNEEEFVFLSYVNTAN